MKTKKLTLLELIITILVLGLLTALAMPQFIGVKANADVATFKNDIDVLHKAVDEMYVREDKLPLSDQVNTTEKPLDAKLLDVVYASGDSGKHLYKIDIDQSKKYHTKLKTPVDEENFFVYSKETGRIFYTKGFVDGDGKTVYTMDYIGLSNLKLGADPLINNMSVPVDETIQALEGLTDIDSEVSVSINGTSIPVTYEDVAFEGSNNISAGTKFTSEILLTQNKNVLTIKSGSTMSNFNIYLGESGEEVTSPVIKPTAVISMTPEQGITTSTTITWGYENSTTAEGRTIVGAEWEGKQDLYSTEGVYTVRLRVQDSTGVWSDWVEKTFAVISSDGIKQIATGFNHTLILKKDNTLWAAGKNNSGQLGAGNTTDSSAFIQVASNVKSVSAGYGHTLIIKEDNTLWGTGLNDYGQLGIGNINHSNTFIHFIQVASGVKSVSAGHSHTLIIKEDNTLWAAGYNVHGQLGTGHTNNPPTFVQVASGVKGVSANQFHTVIVKEDSTLWATGVNSSGQYGNGSKINSNSFVQVEAGVKNVSAGFYHTLILKEDNTLWAAGNNLFGQLGTGNTTDSSTFIQVASDVKSVTTGSSHTLVVKEDNTLWVTGINNFGQLGTGNTTNSSVFIQVASGVKSVTAGSSHTLVVKEDNTLWATGRNNFGQLGVGNTTNLTTYVQVSGLE